MAVAKVPLGKGKGSVAVTEADDTQLTTFVSWYDSVDCDEASKRKWTAVVAACRAEILHRSQPPPAAAAAPKAQRQRAQPASAALVREAPAAMLTLTSDPAAINKRFDELREAYILVAPATHIDQLPEGFGVSIAFVVVNPDPSKEGPGEVYSVGKKVSPSANIIQQIAQASAIDWDSRLSGRLDDGSDPRYVHYRAVGWAKNFDGTPRQIPGEVEIDARDGSDQVNEIISKAERRKQQYPNDRNHDGGASQILELRKFILRHAETKAQNRATMRGLGLKRAYHPAELKKPFAVARLVWTGHSEDPELRKEFARMAAQAALHGSRALYGEPPPPQLPAAPEGHAPPPVGNVPDADFDEEDPDGDDADDGAFGSDVSGAPPGTNGSAGGDDDPEKDGR